MQAVALDLDGTLVELPVDIEHARREVGRLLASHGHRGPLAPILAIIDEVSGGLSAARAEALRAACRAVLDRAELAAAAQAVVRPGAARLLAACADRAVPFAVVTDNGAACVAAALRHVGLPQPAFLVARDHVMRSKPAPDGLVIAARALLPDGGRLLWVGDSPRDVAAGRAARPQVPGIALTVAAVRGGRGGERELLAAGPERLVTSLAELAVLAVGR